MYKHLSRLKGFRNKCKGKMIKFICHLSTEDLVLFDKENRLEDGRPNCFVANKFDVEVDPSAIICNARRVLAQEYMNKIT